MDYTTFVLDDFFNWSRSLIKNYVWSFQTLNFKFQIVQIKSHGEMTKIKILHLDEFYNFDFGDFSIWNHLLTPIFVQSCQILKIQNLNCSNELICKNDQYNSCRSRWVLQFCCGDGGIEGRPRSSAASASWASHLPMEEGVRVMCRWCDQKLHPVKVIDGVSSRFCSVFCDVFFWRLTSLYSGAVGALTICSMEWLQGATAAGGARDSRLRWAAAKTGLAPSRTRSSTMSSPSCQHTRPCGRAHARCRVRVDRWSCECSTFPSSPLLRYPLPTSARTTSSCSRPRPMRRWPSLPPLNCCCVSWPWFDMFAATHAV